jgi:hypothetical protein
MRPLEQFEETISNGQVIPEFLRAGVNLVRGGGGGAHDAAAAATGDDEAQEEEAKTVSGTAAELAAMRLDEECGNGEACGILRW